MELSNEQLLRNIRNAQGEWLCVQVLTGEMCCRIQPGEPNILHIHRPDGSVGVITMYPTTGFSRVIRDATWYRKTATEATWFLEEDA